MRNQHEKTHSDESRLKTDHQDGSPVPALERGRWRLGNEGSEPGLTAACSASKGTVELALTPRLMTSGSLTRSLCKSYSLSVPPQASGTQQICPFLEQHTTARSKQPLPQTSTHIHSLPSPPLDTQGQYLLSRSFPFPLGPGSSLPNTTSNP